MHGLAQWQKSIRSNASSHCLSYAEWSMGIDKGNPLTPMLMLYCFIQQSPPMRICVTISVRRVKRLSAVMPSSELSTRREITTGLRSSSSIGKGALYCILFPVDFIMALWRHMATQICVNVMNPYHEKCSEASKSNFTGECSWTSFVIYLTHFPLVSHICVSELGRH